MVGRNNKGLVTYDRKTKKDAFYLYKAYWSKEPVVYIASRRFVNRAPDERDITVYTNADSITLEVNGAVVGKDCLIGAGALVPQGAVIPDGSLVIGSPAKVRRALTAEEIEMNRKSAVYYVAEGKDYQKQQLS